VGRLDAEGSLYYHAVLFFVALILFVSLKNIDFTDYESSPFLTETQVQFLWYLLIILLFWVAIITIRGFAIKTPDYATRGMFSIVIVTLGLFVILLNLLWDPFNDADTEIGGFGAVSIAVSALLVAVGMIVYTFVKFSEDRQQKWFIEAVKDSLERVEVGEFGSGRRYGSRRRGTARRSSGRRGRGRRAKARAKSEYVEPIEEPVETPMPQPRTTPVQSSPSVQRGAGAAGGAQGGTTPMASPNIIKCPQCTVPLKIPDVPTRPLSIRCPHCGSIATIE
jgi:hypothetical protein